MIPRYPIYIVSKGRWENPLTALALERCKIPYHIVVEPQEKEKYGRTLEQAKILTLPFSNLGMGSIPARNWIWQHSIDCGATSHWIMDDNIRDFYRLHNNVRIRVGGGGIFRASEDFVDRYENIAMSGFHYRFFAVARDRRPPFYLNTRVYSCILLRNDIPYRWRGRYNEDTDLSLRILKDGHCTVLFLAFLADKVATMTMKGGNTESLYKDDGRLRMAKSLQEQHPDIVKVTQKWGRWQHSVDYSMFTQKLKLKPNIIIPEAPDNYGMQLITEEGVPF